MAETTEIKPLIPYVWLRAMTAISFIGLAESGLHYGGWCLSLKSGPVDKHRV